MKKMYSILLLSVVSMLQGMEQSKTVSLPSESEVMRQSASVNILSIADFWSNFTPYLLYNEGPQVTKQTIKASSCVDKATFAVFKNSRLKDLLINLFERYALNKPLKKEEVLEGLFPVLFANVQQTKALYDEETVAIEAFVETLKSSAQNKDWTPALNQLEVIRKEPRLVSQLNKAYWDVNPYVRTTVLSYALLLNAPKELIKSLIDCGAPLTNLSPKILPPLLILAMKTTGAITRDLAEILGEKVVSVISNEAADRTSVKELMTLLCASGAQIEDTFCNSSTTDRSLKDLSALEWALIAYDKDLLEHLLLQQKNIQQREALLLNPFVIAAKTFTLDHIIDPSMTETQRLAGEECFKLLLEDSKNHISKPFDVCSDVISGLQSFLGLEANKAAELAETITRLISLFIEYGADINHLIEKRTLLDRAQNEGWHETIIDFLIKKGALNSSCEFTQEEIKVQIFRKASQDIILKYMAAQPIEQEKIRELLRDSLEIAKKGCIDFSKNGLFHFICILAVDLGASLEETLDFLTCSENHNQFLSDSPSYGNISSVFHKILSWLHDIKRNCPENVFNEVIKRESLRSLIVRLAERGIKDKPNSEGKTAVQKAYELGSKEIGDLITDAVSKS